LFVINVRDRLPMIVECYRRSTAAASEIHRGIAFPNHGSGLATGVQNALTGNLTVIVDGKWLRLATGKKSRLAVGVLKALTLVRLKVDRHADDLAATVEPYALGTSKSLGKTDLKQSHLAAPYRRTKRIACAGNLSGVVDSERPQRQYCNAVMLG
jgi:hypothetical protein